MVAPDTAVTLFGGSDPIMQQFTGNTSALGADAYRDTNTPGNLFTATLGYYAEGIGVRVAKPAIADTAGG